MDYKFRERESLKFDFRSCFFDFKGKKVKNFCLKKRKISGMKGNEIKRSREGIMLRYFYQKERRGNKNGTKEKGKLI